MTYSTLKSRACGSDHVLCRDILEADPIQVYSLHPAKTIHVASKFCSTKTVSLDYSKVYLIKAILNNKT